MNPLRSHMFGRRSLTRVLLVLPLLAALLVNGFASASTCCNDRQGACCKPALQALGHVCCDPGACDNCSPRCGAEQLTAGCCCATPAQPAVPAGSEHRLADSAKVALAQIDVDPALRLNPSAPRPAELAKGLDVPVQPSLNVLFCTWLI